MPTFSLRILLAVDDLEVVAQLAAPLRQAGHNEIIVVEARGETALKATCLVHPDLLILSGQLRGDVDLAGLSAALLARGSRPVPVLPVANPADLPRLLAQHIQSLSANPGS